MACDAIIHTAGQVAVTASVTDPVGDFETNDLGMLSLLEGARASNTEPRIVFCSTNKVNGNNVNQIRQVEKDRCYWRFEGEQFTGVPESCPPDRTHHSPYGSSKLASDPYVQEYGLRRESLLQSSECHVSMERYSSV